MGAAKSPLAPVFPVLLANACISLIISRAVNGRRMREDDASVKRFCPAISGTDAAGKRLVVMEWQERLGEAPGNLDVQARSVAACGVVQDHGDAQAHSATELQPKERGL